MHIITLSVHLYIIVHVYFNRFVWYMAFRENFVGMPVFPSVTHHIQVSQVCLRLFEEFVFERGRFRQFLSSLAHHSAANAVSERNLQRKITKTRQQPQQLVPFG